MKLTYQWALAARNGELLCTYEVTARSRNVPKRIRKRIAIAQLEDKAYPGSYQTRIKTIPAL